MSYKVIEKESVYNITEKDTGHIVAKSTDHADARKICRSLNLGSGFQGFTPEFFVYEYKLVK